MFQIKKNLSLIFFYNYYNNYCADFTQVCKVSLHIREQVTIKNMKYCILSRASWMFSFVLRHFDL